MPKCFINNQPVEVPEGTSIIEAFKKQAQDIAHYCWHEGLSVAGVCRLCMVEIEGQSKLQIACNTMVKEGMKISNQSPKVKQAVKWGLEFHLINHPLDCPICDQAGECELQEQYMKFGRYRPSMAWPKVKKRKVVSLGSKVVLDTERCILCSRCVRFTDEVSKTHELGIFNRGDKSEIGIFQDKPLENNYALNTVDICPVGALTSKHFRFQQRVWYLKTARSVCTGCSTGCNIDMDYNEEGVFRFRPRYNGEVNKHWMCDKGRGLHTLPNKEGRLKEVQVSCLSDHHRLDKDGLIPAKLSSPDHNREGHLPPFATKDILQSPPPSAYTRRSQRALDLSIRALKHLRGHFVSSDKITSVKNSHHHALVLTAQYTVEELEDVLSFFLKFLGGKEDVYYWQNNPEGFNDFDGLLLRGDKNPNTAGLLKVLNSREVKTLPISGDDLKQRLKDRTTNTVWVAGPENQAAYPDLKDQLKLLTTVCENVIWWTAHPLLMKEFVATSLESVTFPSSKHRHSQGGGNPKKAGVLWQIPTKTFFEKEGTFINFKGLAQKIHPVKLMVEAALSLSESVQILKGQALDTRPAFLKEDRKTNHFTTQKRAL